MLMTKRLKLLNYFESGSKVVKGDVIFEIETTKVNVDSAAPVSGIIHHSVLEGDTMGIGKVLCVIYDENESQLSEKRGIELVDRSKNNRLRISKAALKKANELNLDLSHIKEGMISVADVEMISKNKDTNTFDSYDGGSHPKMLLLLLVLEDMQKPALKLSNKITNMKLLE